MPDVLINRDDPRYFLVDNNDSPRPNARIRINAQVTGVYPATVDDLPRCILVVCRDCFVATRLSSLDAGDGYALCAHPLVTWAARFDSRPVPIVMVSPVYAHFSVSMTNLLFLISAGLRAPVVHCNIAHRLSRFVPYFHSNWQIHLVDWVPLWLRKPSRFY